MSDNEKSEWQKRWDEHEWTMETVARYFNDMSHEIRTPTTVVLTKLEVLKQMLEKVKAGEIPFERLEKTANVLFQYGDKLLKSYDDMVFYGERRSIDTNATEQHTEKP